MALSNRAQQRVEQKTGLKVDPKLVVASYILQLQRHELEQAIEQELNDNPALERLEIDDEPTTDPQLLKKIAQLKERPQYEDLEAPPESAPTSDGAVEWVDFVPAPASLHDYLLAQMLALAPDEDRDIVGHVVDCVGETGYLDMPVEEIAHTAGADLDRIRELVKLLQTCNPPGVGAHDLRECLDIQLRESPDPMEMLALRIVRDHWEHLIQRNPHPIARRYKLSVSTVESAFAKIAELSPYPGEAFLSEREAHTSASAPSVEPDVRFVQSEAGITIEIRGCDPAEFIVNPWYREQYRKSKSHPHAVPEDERRHLKEYVGRAMHFIKGVHQRRLTLRKLAQRLLEVQYGFIATGSYRFLKPMTRVQLARDVGLHESTVSRATMNKFVQLANGETIPFEVFFKPALRVQKMIEEILQTENPNKPLSDREIAERLKAQGLEVARRTVNKYREQIRLLSSHRRRTA